MTDLFHAVDKMEDPIRRIGEAAGALQCIATSDHAPEGTGKDALFFVASQLEEVAKQLDRMQQEAFRLARDARPESEAADTPKSGHPCHLRAVRDDDGGAA